MVRVIDPGRTAAVGPSEPSAVGDHGLLFAPARRAVIATAGEKQLVRIGATPLRPVRRMVNFAAITRHQTIRASAAPIAGVADESLVSGGKAFLPAQV